MATTNILTKTIEESTLQALKAIGYTDKRPTKDGWYFVIFAPGDAPQRVYLHVTEHGISWGHDAEDDPEMVGGDGILYRQASG